MPKGVYDRSHIVHWNLGGKRLDLSGKNNPRWNSVEKTCMTCQKQFWIKKIHADARKTCSRECHKKYRSVHISGSNSGAWKGGISRNWSMYNGQFNAALKMAIRERDGHKCVFCYKDNKLQVHHFNHNTKDNRPDNLILVCMHCHALLHRFTDRSNGVLNVKRK